MATLNPYLNFNGNTEEAFTFYKSAFGGEFVVIQRYNETPEGDKLSPEEGEKIMHISLEAGPGNILMATDALESMGHKMQTGNNFYISISTGSKEEADHLFNGLSAGGTVEVPISDSPWGSYFGMFGDKFGIRWMVSYDAQHPA